MTTITTAKSAESTAKRSLQIKFGMASFRQSLIYAALIVFSAFFLFPLIWMISTSLKTIQEVSGPQFNILPADPQWINYTKLFNEAEFYRSYANSIFVVTLVLLGTVTSIALVAYAFSRLTWPGKNVVFALMMGTLLLPYQTTLVPQYVLFHALGWINTFNPITIPGFFAGGAALVFLLRQFMMGLPKELDEAAAIDGANPIQIWWYVILPLCRPALATISVFLFVGQWTNLIQPLIYLEKAQLYTLPIFVANKNNLQISPLPIQDVMAASVLFIIPLLIVFILTQRYFVESVVLTGSKG